MIKVAIADDHAIVRKGLKQILSDIPDMEVVAEAGSGDDSSRWLGCALAGYIHAR
jgi:DNA-binding NarL/FixJ family response regulator